MIFGPLASHASTLVRRLGWWLGVAVLAGRPHIAWGAEPLPLVPKWGRFEQSFQSLRAYANPFQDLTLNVLFISPLGETNRVAGFWDGGNTWRVRFSPDQAGRWTFRTVFSDPFNPRMHDQTGAFLCIPGSGSVRFQRHGPVRVARDHRHFEHADGTPFFWLADTVWSGPQQAGTADWDFYVGARAAQKFTAAQWALVPGPAGKNLAAFSGREHLVIHPEFFRALDEKVDALNAGGLLSVIAPLWETRFRPATDLPEAQAALLLRYTVARWGANAVAWLLAADGGDPRSVERWKRLGRAVFGDTPRAPVVLFPSASFLNFEEFRDETWVDVFGYQSGQNLYDPTVKPVFAGPLAYLWQKEPARPVISVLAPRENGVIPRTGRRITSAEARREAWWCVLAAPPAGTSYSAENVANWNTTASGSDFPAWKKSLFLPAAKQLSLLADFCSAIEFWRLTPAPGIVTVSPGARAPQHEITAASADAGALTVAFVPENRVLEIPLAAVPMPPRARWLDVLTGETSPAVAVAGARNCRFPKPDAGDWLLVIEAGTNTAAR